MRKLLTLIVTIAITSAAYSQSDVYLKINHLLGTSPFAFNANTNNNLSNAFNVDRLEYYISSISITHDGGTITNVPNKWILANASTQVNELLGNFSITTIESVTFSIGVETPTNHNDPSLLTASHPLAPKSPSMHWGWSSGYRFIAMEGMAGTSSPNQNFELHGLGDVNYFSQTIVTSGTSDANGLIIELNADYEQGLKDVNVASGVISHGEVNEAKTLLQNFRDHVFTAANTNVSVADLNKDEIFKMYPNPANASENITYEYNGTLTNVSLELTDLRGRTILKQEVNSSNNNISQKLEQGLYIINLKTSSGEVLNTQKLIVNK